MTRNNDDREFEAKMPDEYDEGLSPAEMLIRKQLKEKGFDPTGKKVKNTEKAHEEQKARLSRQNQGPSQTQVPRTREEVNKRFSNFPQDLPDNLITKNDADSESDPPLDLDTTIIQNRVTKKPKPVFDKEKVIDDRFFALEDLPSNFYPYNGRTFLMIRPFSVVELKLIARAIETGDADFITQAIDNCIDIPVRELTINDYFYLYYWMRIHSYPNTPHYMEWECDEEIPGQGVCKHENLTPLTSKELRIIYLNTLGFDPEVGLDPRLDFPRVSLLQDLNIAQDSKNLIKQNKESEATFSLDDLVLVSAAKWIKEGETLRDKIEVLNRQPDLELYEIASKTNKALEYGVYEFARVNCGRCGAKRRYRVLLDAPRFFPFVD